MTERLSDDEVRKCAGYPWTDERVSAAFDELLALRARVAKLEAALEAGDKPSPQRAIQNDGLN